MKIKSKTGRTITLKKAWKILKDASAVIVDNEVVTFPIVSEYGPYTGEDENEFLFLSWVDDRKSEHCLNFNEGINRKVRVSGSSIFLFDTDNEEGYEHETQITILTPKELE